MTPQLLPAGAHPGRVRLGISSLERSLAFYLEVVGLQSLYSAEGSLVQLGINEDRTVLLELEQLPNLRPLGQKRRLGLYHTAIRLPSAVVLGSFARHLLELGINFGAGDHLYSQAIYLRDPDGLELEISADRPRSEWVYNNGELVTGVKTLDLDELLMDPLPKWVGMPSGTRIGHVHLYVEDLAQARRFYVEALGLHVMTSTVPNALFTSAGGYHHHLAFNTWAAGSHVAAKTDPRMLFWELILPNQDAVQAAAQRLKSAGFPGASAPNGAMLVADPWGSVLALVSESIEAASLRA